MKKTLTKEYLYNAYIVENKKMKDIGLDSGYSKQTISRQLIKYGILKDKPRRLLNKEILEKLYLVDQKSTEDIAKILKIKSHNSIKIALKNFGIPIRHKSFFSLKKRTVFQKLRTGHKNICGSYWCGLKNGAKRRKIEFNITQKYAQEILEKQKFKCALSGELIKTAIRQDILMGLDEQTASLDRIDSSKGYIEGNVQWVHKIPQKMKWDFPDLEYINWCKKVAIYRGNNL